MHGDLCGPVSLATPRGRCYFLLLVNDATRYMWAVLLDSKAAAADVIKHHQATMEEYGYKLWVLHTDNGSEFTSTEFTVYCADEGIQRHYSVPYSPQQNDVVKHRNETVVTAARAPQIARHAGSLLGRGRDARRTPAQPLFDQCARWQDDV